MNKRVYIIHLEIPAELGASVTWHAKYLGLLDGQELMQPFWIQEIDDCPVYESASAQKKLEWIDDKACFTLNNRHLYDAWLNEHKPKEVTF